MLATLTVTDPGDGVVNGPGDQPGTLRQAIFDAENLAGLDTIEFSTNSADDLNGGMILLSQGQLTITDSVTINATMLSAGLTISAGGGTNPVIGNGDGFRVFNITGSTGAVELNGLTLTGGDPNSNGGAIYSTVDSLVIKNCTITGNASGGDGGGIFAHFTLAV